VAGNQTVAQRNLACAIRIRERRRELGLTQAEVVGRVSRPGSRLSNQALSAIENGRRLDVGRLPDLALALDCTVTYLIGLTADPQRWRPDGPDAPDTSLAAGVPVRSTRPATPDPVTRSRRNWILGPDVPDVPAELRARDYETDVATPSLLLARRPPCGFPGHSFPLYRSCS
jgi:transcriptional regulator with XRE-family HTH domain